MDIQLEEGISGDWDSRIRSMARLEIGSAFEQIARLKVNISAASHGSGERVHICRVHAVDRQGQTIDLEMHHPDIRGCVRDGFARLRRQLMRHSAMRAGQRFTQTAGASPPR